jgi:rSAM/selenodomain-associated transferase 1
MASDNLLAILVKYPDAGFVKTRLARSIGESRAASLYRLFVEVTMERTEDSRYGRVVFYAPPEKGKEIALWLGESTERRPQEGNDLGERMHNAFRYAFRRGVGATVIIGTDCPLIDSAVICGAFHRLESHQCVIGPSADGGYYLLGLSSPCEALFREIDWGTDKVLAQTLRAARSLNLSYSLLEERFDVDDLEGLFMLKCALQESPPGRYRGARSLMRFVNELTARVSRAERDKVSRGEQSV